VVLIYVVEGEAVGGLVYDDSIVVCRVVVYVAEYAV
jgi:hypothetical protein